VDILREVVRGRDGVKGVDEILGAGRRQVRDVMMRALCWRVFEELMRAGERGIIVPNSREKLRKIKASIEAQLRYIW
jgi:hypothetical protein